MNRAFYNRSSAHWDAARKRFFGRGQPYLDSGLPDCRISRSYSTRAAGLGVRRPGTSSRARSVVGIDQSEEPLAKAGEHFPEQEWIHATLRSGHT
jgi:hypothetical protein